MLYLPIFNLFSLRSLQDIISEQPFRAIQFLSASFIPLQYISPQLPGKTPIIAPSTTTRLLPRAHYLFEPLLIRIHGQPKLIVPTDPLPQSQQTSSGDARVIHYPDGTMTLDKGSISSSTVQIPPQLPNPIQPRPDSTESYLYYMYMHRKQPSPLPSAYQPPGSTGSITALEQTPSAYSFPEKVKLSISFNSDVPETDLMVSNHFLAYWCYFKVNQVTYGGVPS